MKKIALVALVFSALLFAFQQASAAQTGTAAPAQGKNAPAGIALKADEPAWLAYDAGAVRILASSEDTHGAWSLVELKEMPGYHTNLHRHNFTDESFYVLEGTLTVKTEDTVDYPTGSYVLIPRGTPHAQGNRGKVPVRVLLAMTPGGFEQSFLDRVELFKTVRPGDPDFRRRRDQLAKSSKVDVERLALWDFQE